MLINTYTWEYISVQTLYHALSLRGVPSCELRDRACLAGLAPEVRRTHAIYRSNPVLPRLPAGLYVYRRRLTNAPSRCPECRAAHKQSNRGQRDFSGGGGGRVRDYESRQMYSATCASCGEETQVPFQPRGDRPVYCSVCYQAQRPGLSNGRRSRWS